LFVHEYGHYLQSQKWGFFYLFTVGIPSMISAGISKDNRHSTRWFEAMASNNAANYFDEHYGSQHKDYLPGSADFFDRNSFVTGNGCPYVNPRDPLGFWNSDSNPTRGIFRRSDLFLYSYLAVFLFLL
jgi:hypothetical protein